jgi:hypothetical protein
MRLIDNGKICAVNAREQARLQKWRKQHERKGGKNDKRGQNQKHDE